MSVGVCPSMAKKCKHLGVTKKKNPAQIIRRFRNHVINKTLQETELGVIMNHELSWHDQVRSKVDTANKSLTPDEKNLCEIY